MKNKNVLKVIISLCFTLLTIFIVCPLAIHAALQQNSTIKSSITVETIDSIWCDKDSNTITSLSLPEYVAAGEKITLNDGIYTKNIGVESYARFKLVEKLNNEIHNCFTTIINSNWIKGNDDYYYYINPSVNCIINRNQTVKVIDELYIAETFKNQDKDQQLSISLTLEVIDANSDEYITGWNTNPPQEWFDNIA